MVEPQSQTPPRMSPRPWEDLPAGIAATLRVGLPDVGEEMIAAIRHDVPAYARPLEGAFGQGIRTGVGQALAQFVDLIERPDLDLSPGRAVYRNLGRGEAREGRTLDALLAAYRLGARVAWRHASAAAREAGYDGEALSMLAEAIFAYIDELSAQSAAGYADEQSAVAGEADRRRHALVGLLIQSPPADPQAVQAAADAARWELPRELAALAGPRDPDGRRSPPHVPLGSLVAPVEEHWCALVPDPDAPGRRADLQRAVRGRPAALGPTVPPAQAWRSAQRAFAAQRLVGEGALPADGLVIADEHLADLIAQAGRDLVADLAERRLAPLDDLPEATRARLAETLLAWLDHQGNVPSAAKALHVHPQTVRYRLGQLRELFGDALSGPDARYELLLALRAGRAAGASRRVEGGVEREQAQI